MLVAFTLLIGVASTHAATTRACRDLVVEVDASMRAVRGFVGSRSETWLDLDAKGRPHVTWMSDWSRVSPFGRWHHELHHASLDGRRVKVERVDLPKGANVDAFGFEYGIWTVIGRVDDVAKSWRGPPWRETDDDLSERVHRLHHTQPRVEWRSPWPDGVHRDPDYDAFAIAGRVTVGVSWQPRGEQTVGYHPHGEPYDVYRNEERGRGSLVVWFPEPVVVPSVRLRRRSAPQVQLDASGAIHVLLVESHPSDFARHRYVRLRCGT